MAKIPIPKIHRSMLVQESLAVFNIPLWMWRKTDDLTQLPGNMGDGTNLALVPGAFASNSPVLKGKEARGSTETEFARTQIVLPECYVDGQTVIFRIRCRYGSSGIPGIPGTATIDLRAYESNGESGISADLCDTPAQTFDGTYTDYDFVITPTALITGDLLDLEIKQVFQEAGGGNWMWTAIGRTSLLLDIKG